LIKKPRYLTDGTLDTMFTRSSNTTPVLYHSAARYNRTAHKTEKKKARAQRTGNLSTRKTKLV
jgi:hypothetical protein